MVTGRKLLLADDSVTIQKVVALTFTDEGLEVVTVSDGQQALEKLAEFTPDVVLADVFMPNLNGYQLCEHIKRSDRFSHIPVMLLVGSFEPFDEAEARRVGADDYLTKPFQSIRTLIGKVSTLLSGGSAEGSEAATKRLAPPPEVEREDQLDSDFLERSTADTVPLPEVQEEVERASNSREISFADLSMDDEMIETTPASDYGNAGQARRTVQYSAADLKDAGIAPTAESESAEPQEEPVSVLAAASQVGSGAAPQATEPQSYFAASHEQDAPRPAAASVATSDDSLLDLGDIESPSSAAAEADDFFLDLFDEASPEEQAEASAQHDAGGELELGDEAAESLTSAGEVSASAQPEAYRTDLNSAPTERLPDDYQVGGDNASPAAEASPAGKITINQLSPEVIDAIARRAVELLSEQVVEKIAWEVVPQLAELLVKRKLEENSGQ